MQWILGGLVLLVVIAVYCALVLSKRTDDRVRRYVRDDSAGRPIMVRFPDEVLRASAPAASASTEQRQAS